MSEHGSPLPDYLRFVRRHGWLIVLVPVLAVILAGAFVSRQTPVRSASTEIFVAQAGGATQAQLGELPLTQTMTNILQSNAITTAATRALGFTLSPSKLLANLSVQEDPSSSILTVNYDSTNPGHAVATLQAVETAFENLIRQQLGASGSLQTTGPLQIVETVLDPPHLDPGQVSPNVGRTLAFAVGIGLVIGLALALLRNALDNRIRGRRDAEESFGAPVLAVIPEGSLASASVQRGAPDLEALELLGASIQLHHSDMGRSLLVTSALEDDASSALVASLGSALAQAGQRIVCVDLGGARRNLGRRFALSSDSDSDDGIANVLAGALPLSDALVQVPLQPSTNGASTVSRSRAGRSGVDPREVRAALAEPRWVDNVSGGQLMLLPAGASSSISALVSGKHLSTLVEELSASADYVLFDCPRLLSVGRGLAFAPLVDSVLVVAPDAQTRRERARAVEAALTTLGVQKVAVVLIERRQRWRRRRAKV